MELRPAGERQHIQNELRQPQIESNPVVEKQEAEQSWPLSSSTCGILVQRADCFVSYTDSVINQEKGNLLVLSSL